MREYKFTNFALFTKDNLGPRTRAGVFAVLGNRDNGGDRILPGAFGKTFQENRRHARHLWNHNFSDPPTAKVEDLYEISADDLPDAVRAAAPDAQGGAVVVRTYLDTPRGSEILAALDAGAIDEMSFAYEAVKKEYLEEEINGAKIQTRLIRELRHYESSDVLWGMNGATLATLAIPTEFLAQSLENLLTEIKAGRRNSESDLKMIQTIHDHATQLGAMCDEEAKHRPAPDQGRRQAESFALQLSLAEARLKQFALVSRAA